MPKLSQTSRVIVGSAGDLLIYTDPFLPLFFIPSSMAAAALLNEKSPSDQWTVGTVAPVAALSMILSSAIDTIAIPGLPGCSDTDQPAFAVRLDVGLIFAYVDGPVSAATVNRLSELGVIVVLTPDEVIDTPYMQAHRSDESDAMIRRFRRIYSVARDGASEHPKSTWRKARKALLAHATRALPGGTLASRSR